MVCLCVWCGCFVGVVVLYNDVIEKMVGMFLYCWLLICLFVYCCGGVFDCVVVVVLFSSVLVDRCM